MFEGLRTVIYKVNDVEQAKAWYSSVLGFEPYFSQPYYVGFNVGGYELGLDPDTQMVGPGPGGSVAYWGTSDCREELRRLIELGATEHSPVQDVGEGILVASVVDPFGNIIGLIQNPNFAVR
jgi:predicted enzyme related to lactoylglutathione lyase